MDIPEIGTWDGLKDETSCASKLIWTYWLWCPWLGLVTIFGLGCEPNPLLLRPVTFGFLVLDFGKVDLATSIEMVAFPLTHNLFFFFFFSHVFVGKTPWLFMATNLTFSATRLPLIFSPVRSILSLFFSFSILWNIWNGFDPIKSPLPPIKLSSLFLRLSNPLFFTPFIFITVNHFSCNKSSP